MEALRVTPGQSTSFANFMEIEKSQEQTNSLEGRDNFQENTNFHRGNYASIDSCLHYKLYDYGNRGGEKTRKANAAMMIE